MVGCLVVLLWLAPPLIADAHTWELTIAAPDTNDVQPPADTLGIPPIELELPAVEERAVEDEVRPPPTGPWVGFARPTTGVPIDSLKPARRAHFEYKDYLRKVPGSFTHDLGGYGWPHGWSPLGLRPESVPALLDDMPYNDLITGRMRMDLLPLAFMEPLHVSTSRLGATRAVHAHLRDFDSSEPLTELRYFTGDTGLQTITALHTQERELTMPGAREPGTIYFLFGYGGHAADNEYSNARLSRKRQTLGRIRMEQRTWSLDLRNLQTRRSRGAHGGVVPLTGQPFNAIYVRPIAQVDDGQGQDRTIRNDLSATLRVRTPWAAQERPFTTSGYWSSQTYRYRTASDTLEARVNRYGMRAHQDFAWGRHNLTLSLDAWHDAVDDARGFSSEPSDKQQVHVRLQDSLRVAGIGVTASLGGMWADDFVPTGSVRLESVLGRVRIEGEASAAAEPFSLVEQYGFGELQQPLESGATVPRVYSGGARIATTAGPFDVAAFGHLTQRTNPVELFAIPDEEADVDLNPFELFFPASAELQQDGTGQLIGTAGLDVGFRRLAERGIYATIQPTAFEFLNPNASELHSRAAQALPDLFAEWRLGARYKIFQEDLDLDASLRGRVWTAFAGRTLFEPTGTFGVAEVGSPTLGPSGTLDLVLEGGLRGATLFVAFENLLSGTDLTPGNLLVPINPLPEQRFRFGVFWPIRG